METQNSSFSDFLSNFIIYFLLAILGYVIYQMIFGEGSSRRSCDYVGGEVLNGKIKV